jgi:hypothetical protein
VRPRTVESPLDPAPAYARTRCAVVQGYATGARAGLIWRESDGMMCRGHVMSVVGGVMSSFGRALRLMI